MAMLHAGNHEGVEDPAPSAAARLAFLARLARDLTLAPKPLVVLCAALARIVALTGATTGRLLDSDTADKRLASGGQARGNRSIVPLYDGDPNATGRPGLAIELVYGADSGATSEGNREFFEALARIFGLAQASARLREGLAAQQAAGLELELAAEVQQSLQPDYPPGRLPIWGVNRPARKVSGDFFDFYRLPDDRIAFALGDVSGKGMNAALLMAKTVSLFRCLGKRIDRPAALLEAINAELCETAARGMFVTMVTGHYCMVTGRLCFANAGHEPPLLRHKDRSYDSFPAPAPPLGIMTGTSYCDEQVMLAGGEFLVFTDGLTEYRYANGEQLGAAGLIQLVEATAHEPLAERLEGLLERLGQETGWETRDDLTLLAIDDSWVREDAGIDAPGFQVPAGDRP